MPTGTFGGLAEGCGKIWIGFYMELLRILPRRRPGYSWIPHASENGDYAYH